MGIELLGRALWPEMIGDYIAALTLGILFQYFAIAPMRGLGVRAGLAAWPANIWLIRRGIKEAM